MVAVRLVRLAGVPILQQLHIEQALLRADSQNWLVVNDGSSVPAIVMGISGSDHLTYIRPVDPLLRTPASNGESEDQYLAKDEIHETRVIQAFYSGRQRSWYTLTRPKRPRSM